MKRLMKIRTCECLLSFSSFDSCKIMDNGSIRLSNFQGDHRFVKQVKLYHVTLSWFPQSYCLDILDASVSSQSCAMPKARCVSELSDSPADEDNVSLSQCSKRRRTDSAPWSRRPQSRGKSPVRDLSSSSSHAESLAEAGVKRRRRKKRKKKNPGETLKERMSSIQTCKDIAMKHCPGCNRRCLEDYLSKDKLKALVAFRKNWVSLRKLDQDRIASWRQLTGDSLKMVPWNLSALGIVAGQH